MKLKLDENLGERGRDVLRATASSLRRGREQVGGALGGEFLE